MLPAVLASNVSDAWCEIQDATLRQCPFHEHGNVLLCISDSLETPWHTEVI
jgi:hypothetical protein